MSNTNNQNSGSGNGFFNSILWKILAFSIPTLISAITLFVAYYKLPEQIEAVVKNINETHANVNELTCNLKDKLVGGQDVGVAISSRAPNGQAIVLTNSKLSYKEGQFITLHNPGSTFKPRIKLLISSIEEPNTQPEKDGKVQIYINKNAASMLDYKAKLGFKRLKILEFVDSNKTN